ncbi:MAG: DUF6662 family protein [Sinimarinibacterium sp.]|jgi:hypothetical protein
MKIQKTTLASSLLAACLSPPAHADENLFGYVNGAEPLPKGALEIYEKLTLRSDKGRGEYTAWDSVTEIEYGLTDKLAVIGAIEALAIDTEGLVIDGYLPGDNSYGPRASGVEAYLKYNFLSPAKSSFGVSMLTALRYAWRDPHSGQDKDTINFEEKLLLQKYFLDGQLIWATNLGIEATHAERHAIDNLPEGFDWPTDPEMEIELIGASGLSYRFAPSWFLGAEVLWEEEHETEVGLERWSLQGGPTLHYGSQKWWATFSWLPQIKGGGEKYPDQPDMGLHLIEKTEQEYRLKVGINL